MATHAEYNLSLQDRDSYVFASVTAPAGAPVQKKDYLDRIADHCLECACASILIEKRTAETFDVWEAFKMAPKLSKIGREQIRVAVSELEAEPAAKRELDMVVGGDRRVCVKIFDNTSEAKEWLAVT